MIFSDSNTKIAPALVKSWGEMESPKHNTSVKMTTKNGGSYTFEYTDLGGILDEAKRVLKDNGISIIQSAHTTKEDGQLIVSVETLLLHSSGEWVKSEPLQVPAAHGIQDMGGQITYMKRYSLSAMLGLSTEKDDDANGAAGNTYDHTSKGRSNSGNVTIAASVRAKYQLVFGNLDGIEKYVTDHGAKADELLAAEMKKKAGGTNS